ncbi:MAG: hypothetical protein FWG57_07185 [Endomicrobia bacterium]|nr:hypothetical protein [Endomicrobiia bacterium]
MEQQKRYMVCYLDILGFSDWYNENNKEKLNTAFQEVLNEFKVDSENFINLLCVNMKDNTYKYKNEEEQQKYIEVVLKETNIVFLSDSIIVSVPVMYENINEEPSALLGTLYFMAIMVIAIAHKIMKNLNLFVRGAIAYGKDYSFSPIANYHGKIIQSSVLIDAVKKERDVIYPRVVIDNAIFNKMLEDDFVKKFKASFFFKDFDCKQCLNLYARRSSTDTTTQEFKDIIEKNLQLCLSKKDGIDHKILEKIMYLIRLHNVQVKRLEQNEYIDVDKIFFENIEFSV